MLPISLNPSPHGCLLYAIVNKPATPFLTVPGLRPSQNACHASMLFLFSTCAHIEFFFSAPRVTSAFVWRIASTSHLIWNSRSPTLVAAKAVSLFGPRLTPCAEQSWGCIQCTFLFIWLITTFWWIAILFAYVSLIHLWFYMKIQLFLGVFFLLYKYALRILYYGAGYGFVIQEEWAVSNKHWEGMWLFLTSRKAKKLYTVYTELAPSPFLCRAVQR